MGKPLIILTRQLLDNTEFANGRFKQTKLEGKRGDFYTEVKPFADEVKDTVEKWRAEAAQWVIQHKPKNLHHSQIVTAADYLEVISVQAFFPETSKKRFLDQIQSIDYILNGLLNALIQEGKR